MPRIFISYRRQDSSNFTGRIHDRLVREFGDRNVFRDVYDIPAGSDFRTILKKEVSQGDIFLAIIGPQWVDITDSQGNRRLDDPNDFVRIEVELALNNPNTLVIPVLVNNAKMPVEEDLPESLRELCYRNAVVVRTDPDFPTDMERLIRQLQPRAWINVLRKSWPALVGITLVLAILFIIPPISTLFDQVKATATIPVQISVPKEENPNSDGYPISLGEKYTVAFSFSIYQHESQDALIIARVSANESLTILERSADNVWMKIQLDNGDIGWALTDDLLTGLVLPTAVPTNIATTVAVGQGFGTRTDIWQLYFTDPGQSPDQLTEFGIDVRLADAISRAKTSVDIAIFELDNPVITQAILDIHDRDIEVRVITDDEHGMEADKEPGRGKFALLEKAGIPIVTDGRSALMHNKFIILDGTTIWTGSWNLTENSTFKQNNNTLAFNSPEIAALFQAEFDEMFRDHSFGPRSPSGDQQIVNVDGIQVEIYFAPEDDIRTRLLELVNSTQRSIRFMAFSFSDDTLGIAMRERLQQGVSVEGIFEKIGSETEYSELIPFFCSGAKVRQDGNPSFLHHKIIILDDEIVITGSTNFSNNAFESNDENIIIVHDSGLAAAYNQEFDRLWDVATPPVDILCE